MENTTQITVADLDAVRGIIDLASSRGAFKANELAAVGSIFNKLSSFIEAVSAQAKAAAEAEASNTETTTDTTAETQGE